jgi:hypothetical protein
VSKESALRQRTDCLWNGTVDWDVPGVRLFLLLDRFGDYGAWVLVHGEKINGISLSIDEYDLAVTWNKE